MLWVEGFCEDPNAEHQAGGRSNPQEDFISRQESKQNTKCRAGSHGVNSTVLQGHRGNETQLKQKIHKGAVRLVFHLPRRVHVTPLFIELHWLPVAALIKYKSLTLTDKVLLGPNLPYIPLVVQAYTASGALCSSQECRLVLSSLQKSRSQSRLFITWSLKGGTSYQQLLLLCFLVVVVMINMLDILATIMTQNVINI